MRIIDITQELFSCRLFPGDKPPTYRRVKTMEQDRHNLTAISMNVHNGTHIDAPNHFVAGGKAIHELDLALFYGKCTVAELDGIICESKIKSILETCQERLLIKGQIELSEAAARLIGNSHVKLIGVEDQSVAPVQSPLPVHVILLEKEVIPLEGLDLSAVTPGEYLLTAFPLNMDDADGSPVRAVLIEN